MNSPQKLPSLKAIIGLGNPGPEFSKTRHNIGFIILDVLAQQHSSAWQKEKNMLQAQINLDDKNLLLIKPQTFMNDSGAIFKYLFKNTLRADEILVIHDELELPFGKLKIRTTGSAKGHNGLKSIMATIGPDFARLSFGIGRPEHKEDVPHYVLAPFNLPQEQLNDAINKAIELIQSVVY